MKNHLLLQNPVFVIAKMHVACDALILKSASVTEFTMFQKADTFAVVFRTELSCVVNPAAAATGTF